MKPQDIAAVLPALIAKHQPVYIEGAPGIGKSEVIHQVTTSMGREMFDFRAAQRDPVDLIGVPYPDLAANLTRWLTPDFLPTSGTGVFFMDELPQASQPMQGALLQIARDRKVGNWTMPEGWDIVAAGNGAKDRAGSGKLTTALASRFVRIGFELDAGQWCKWAITSGKILPEIVAFIQYRPTLLSTFEPNAAVFACPRTWEFASNTVACNYTPAVELELLQGTVGEGVTTELVGFLRLWRANLLTMVDAALLNPDTASVPSQPDQQFALAGALSRRATTDNLDRVLKYAVRLGPEPSAFVAQTSTSRDPRLCNTAAFTSYAATHGDLFS